MKNLSHKIFHISLLPVIFLVFFNGTWTDIFLSVPEKAERAYKEKQYEKALELYQEAQTRNPDSDTIAYNLGNTLYKIERYEDAAGQYGRILEKETPGVTPNALYNMGNSLFQMGRQTENQEMLKKSLEAYKHSIRLKPQDEDSKYNFELVRRLLKEQQQQQQQKDQDKQKEDQQKQQQDQEKDQEQKQAEQQQQQQQQAQASEEEQERKPGKMREEEADRILDFYELQEKEMQEREKEKKARALRKRGPDW